MHWLDVAEKKKIVDCFRSWDLHNTLRLSCTSIWWCYTSCRAPIWIPIKRSQHTTCFYSNPFCTLSLLLPPFLCSFHNLIRSGSFGSVIFYICITHKCHWHTDLLCTYPSVQTQKSACIQSAVFPQYWWAFVRQLVKNHENKNIFTSTSHQWMEYTYNVIRTIACTLLWFYVSVGKRGAGEGELAWQSEMRFGCSLTPYDFFAVIALYICVYCEWKELKSACVTVTYLYVNIAHCTMP